MSWCLDLNVQFMAVKVVPLHCDMYIQFRHEDCPCLNLLLSLQQLGEDPGGQLGAVLYPRGEWTFTVLIYICNLYL